MTATEYEMVYWFNSKVRQAVLVSHTCDFAMRYIGCCVSVGIELHSSIIGSLEHQRFLSSSLLLGRATIHIFWVTAWEHRQTIEAKNNHFFEFCLIYFLWHWKIPGTYKILDTALGKCQVEELPRPLLRDFLQSGHSELVGNCKKYLHRAFLLDSKSIVSLYRGRRIFKCSLGCAVNTSKLIL